MSTLKQLAPRFEALLGREIEFYAEAVNEEKDFVLDLNREQLYDGKDREGNDLHPTYFEDPYFKSPAQAAGYSRWKDKITPNPRRTPGVPNLFINGYYYKSIVLAVDKQGLKYNSGFDDQNNINQKYGGKLYGLDKDNRIILNKTAGPRAIELIRTFVRI